MNAHAAPEAEAVPPAGRAAPRGAMPPAKTPRRVGSIAALGMLIALVDIPDLLLSILTWVIIIQVVLSWLLVANVLNTGSHGVRSFAVALDRITAPIYRPIRRMLHDFGGIDFSPLGILILIQVIKKLLAGVVTQ